MARLDELGVPEPEPRRGGGPRDGRRYEMLDEQPRAFWTVAGGLALAIAIGLGISFATLVAATPRGAAANPPIPTPADVRAFPEPRLQAAPADEIRDQRAAQRALLESWAWVDPEGGYARIPVTRAAELFLRHGRAASRPESRTGR
jgi:hypothetical protein